jgi:hypothetical protein
MRRRLGLLVPGVLLMVAGTAFAQDTSRGEFSGGWRYYHATLDNIVTIAGVDEPNDYPKGWYADVALHLSPKFAIVGEAGGTYFDDEASQTFGSTLSTTESADVTFHTFMGGVRVRAPQDPRLIPFGQVLFGGEHLSGANDRTITVLQRPTSTSHWESSSSNAALALDGGATIRAGVIGVRASVGYVRFFGGADADMFRLSLGAAFRF